jgi:hypothetical protein
LHSRMSEDRQRAGWKSGYAGIAYHAVLRNESYTAVGWDQAPAEQPVDAEATSEMPRLLKFESCIMPRFVASRNRFCALLGVFCVRTGIPSLSPMSGSMQ